MAGESGNLFSIPLVLQSGIPSDGTLHGVNVSASIFGDDSSMSQTDPTIVSVTITNTGPYFAEFLFAAVLTESDPWSHLESSFPFQHSASRNLKECEYFCSTGYCWIRCFERFNCRDSCRSDGVPVQLHRRRSLHRKTMLAILSKRC